MTESQIAAAAPNSSSSSASTSSTVGPLPVANTGAAAAYAATNHPAGTSGAQHHQTAIKDNLHPNSGSLRNRLRRPYSHQDLRTSQDGNGNLLKLSDVPNNHEIYRLSSSYSASSIADSTSSNTNKLATSPATSATSTWSRSSSRDRDTTTNTTDTTTTTSLTASHSTDSNLTPDSLPTNYPSSQPPSAIRKTSPGLAARLKALGFGTSKKNVTDPSPVTPPEPIGRLDQRQLRQLDEKHLAGSLSSVISRRGRPWRGAGASSSLKSSASQPNLNATIVPEHSPQLPEIQSPEPLVMDTQKYRLPVHTNGNGTKVTLDTRREHLERQVPDPAPVNVVSAVPPPPPPKDTPPPPVSPPATANSESTDYVPGLSSYFTPGHNRPGSIYTLSRASFANQLAQLTSLQLPDADSLSSKVSAIPTAAAAAKALTNAADQIRSWISKAQEVIGGLDSEDDVEWAAAGGREGLEEVENAIVRFEELINAYVGAIEELQRREDVSRVATDDLKRAVTQMEIIVEEWAKIRKTLHNVRAQVEIAMEWEELWNNVLGDIQNEMDELSRLVFEMEERRHKSIVAGTGGDNDDIGELETIVEDTPGSAARLKAHSSRFSLPTIPMAPNSPGSAAVASGLSQDDSSLLALFARMQPLRASLDFLPMRLSVFETRADKSFPTACEELEMRRAGLDGSYKKLEKDAESLRKELGEDRWVVVFRGAGRQAQKMQESVERSLLKLREAIETNLHISNPPAMMKKIESYEAKKMHYGPAIERVLSIIDRGVKDRLTVNGEILRLDSDIQSRWSILKEQMKEMDLVVEDILAEGKSRQLRDSVSSLLSNDRSTTGSGQETPGSSPPSSVIMSTLGFDPHTPVFNKHRAARSPASANRRHSAIPAPTSTLPKRTNRLSTIPSSSANTPLPPSRIQRPASTMDHRPRWNGSTNTNDLQVGHTYKPAPATPNQPHAHKTPGTHRSVSAMTPSSGTRLPTIRSSFVRGTSESPRVDGSPSRPSHSRLSFRDRMASPGPYSQQVLSKPKLANKSSMSALSSNRRVSMQPTGSSTSAVEESQVGRPASSLGSTRSRTNSLLPQPKFAHSEAGRASPRPGGSRLGMRRDAPKPEPKDSKPKWRF